MMGNILFVSIGILLTVVVFAVLLTFLINLLVSFIEEIEWR